MKRALAARAKHDPNGLASVVSSSPQPPVKIQRIEEKHDTVHDGVNSTGYPALKIEQEEPPTMSPNVHTSSQQNIQQESQLVNEKANAVSSLEKSHSTPKSKQSMKRQRSSQPSPTVDDDSENSGFFLKHQNAALASELHQLRYQCKLLEKEREFRRGQCQQANQSLHALEATWNAMEVALQLGQQPDQNGEEETAGSKTLPEDAPRSTGTGESVEFIGTLLDSLAAIAKDSVPEEMSSPEDSQILDIRRTAASVSKRATALQRWIWGLLRKVMSGEEAGKPPLLRLAKLEAKSSTLKSQIRDFQSQIAELAKSKDDAIESERKVRRGLYRLHAGRMRLEEVMEAIETDDKDGSDALLAVEENSAKTVGTSQKDHDEEGIDGAQVAMFRKQIRDLEEIASSREKQIEDLVKQREVNMKRINELALPSDSDKVDSMKDISEDDIKSSELYKDTWTRMTTAERQLVDMRDKLAQTKESWAASRGDAELSMKSLEDHLLKHKKRWAELTDASENETADTEELLAQPEAMLQAERIAQLEHKLNQALESVRRADGVRLSLDELMQTNETLQARLNELKSRNAALVQHSKQAAKPEMVIAQEKPSVKGDALSSEKAEKLYRKVRKDLAAALASKENAKSRLEKSEKERESLLKTNSRLVKQSAEKDEMNAKSLSTILHLKSVTEKLSQEKELLEQQVRSSGQVNVAARLAANARDRVTAEALNQLKTFEEKVAGLERECERLMAVNERAVGDLAQKHAEMADLERDAATAKERCDELVSASTKIEEEKRKVVESLAVAQREAGEATKLIAKMRSQKGGENSDFTTEELTTQVSVLKNRLTCPVCNHRDKSCIVIRCRHMFCKHCIDENVKNRNRKCPSCGQKFDTKDIEDIWL